MQSDSFERVVDVGRMLEYLVEVGHLFDTVYKRDELNSYFSTINNNISYP